ncbi:class I SAM-dependent methyltransferase [Thalassospira marina]|uniref:Cyclopropane-fatty-acyl-phospholipid synthase n=1 Tax=Thalassospira marina TaxID=2048283 RepID=A0A2N3KTI4_9PROT|nr:class I SAM-dependent methyltransferase [Thalassospira marina]AUG55740.1 cyclopropane-fatty-acyl-phospholipid synthase [Thalassospira marina]PKR53865.1 cyclopropane-fatty-acyl-phospholipid synthase [Thalassospira marina]
MNQSALKEVPAYGGSPSAIQFHYDVGREFYQLWLDDSMTYSSALWSESDDDTLNAAQQRKIDYHLEQARARQASSLLDIGCGWGALVNKASSLPNLHKIVGLTLSNDQADYVRGFGLPNLDIRLESWTEHHPTTHYDSIISVGAFEHFVKPEDSTAEKIATYRDFFEKCAGWLSPGGWLSLQTFVYGTMKNEEASAFINHEIFPAADLPRLEQIMASVDGVMELTKLVNHRLHYARTYDMWARNLRRRRDEAVDLVGEAMTNKYERYLKQTSIGFYTGKIGLLRMTFRPVDRSLSVLAKE